MELLSNAELLERLQKASDSKSVINLIRAELANK